jgi:maleylacetate reductase
VAPPLEFVYQALPMRVVVGPGSLARVGEELDRLGISNALVLCSPEQADTGQAVADLLGDRSAGVLAEARMPMAASPSAAAPRSGWARRSRSSSGCPSSRSRRRTPGRR